MTAVAERFRLRTTAPAEDKVLLHRVRVTVGVNQRDVSFNEIGSALANFDRDIVHRHDAVRRALAVYQPDIDHLPLRAARLALHEVGAYYQVSSRVVKTLSGDLHRRR